MSGEIWFYHLESSDAETVLPDLLQKSLARGWKALVVSPDASRLASLDQRLWTWRDDSFLPHGLAEAGGAEHQPVLLSETQDNLNQASILFLLDGAEPEAPESYERTVLMFDGGDEAAVIGARKVWKQASGAGRSVSYWKQTEAGRWEKKA